MVIKAEDMLEWAREQRIRIEEQDLEDERERKRERDLQEANIRIQFWKRIHSRKRKTVVRISLLSDYNMKLERHFYILRLFVGSDLEEMLPVTKEAGLILKQGLENTVQGGLTFYTIWSNQQKK